MTIQELAALEEPPTLTRQQTRDIVSPFIKFNVYGVPHIDNKALIAMHPQDLMNIIWEEARRLYYEP